MTRSLLDPPRVDRRWPLKLAAVLLGFLLFAAVASTVTHALDYDGVPAVAGARHIVVVEVSGTPINDFTGQLDATVELTTTDGQIRLESERLPWRSAFDGEAGNTVTVHAAGLTTRTLACLILVDGREVARQEIATAGSVVCRADL